jgi:endonuclease/exonuclease/phosphatase family metal-dependent hydrolase
MENTLTVTTFNSLNNPDRKEERVEILFQELKEHDSDVVLLQEVLEGTFPLIEAKALQDGWFISEGSRVKQTPQKIYGNVTLSRIPVESQFMLPSGLSQTLPHGHVEALITHFENDVTTINAHFPWGGRSELHRLDAAYRINQYAECLREQEPDRLIILGGDLNATLSSSALRYLNAELIYKDSSTFWTNAWNFSDEVFPTARKDGGWAETTAKSVGIQRPEMMPERTIDHILTYDWNFGKSHCPLSLKKFGESNLSNGFGLSDHYGLTVKVAL